MFENLKRLSLLATVVASYAVVASALPILTVPGDPTGNLNGVGGESLLAASWTQTVTVNNPIITVFNLANSGAETLTASFYLFNALPAADALGTAFDTVDVGALAEIDATLSGLPTSLGPDTYYLVASATGDTLGWRTGLAGTSAAGVTINQSLFTVDGTWISDPTLNLGFAITGDIIDPAEIPEPATWMLMGSGLVAAGCLRRKRRG